VVSDSVETVEGLGNVENDMTIKKRTRRSKSRCEVWPGRSLTPSASRQWSLGLPSERNLGAGHQTRMPPSITRSMPVT